MQYILSSIALHNRQAAEDAVIGVIESVGRCISPPSAKWTTEREGRAPTASAGRAMEALEYNPANGELDERFKSHAWKACEG